MTALTVGVTTGAATPINSTAELSPGLAIQSEPTESTEIAVGAEMASAAADGALIASYRNDGQGVHFHLSDWLGTRRVQTSYAGAVEDSCTSSPFGDGLSCTNPGADVSTVHFTGKERDAESGLDYFGARMYAAGTGRFMSPDSSASPVPIPFGDLSSVFAAQGNQMIAPNNEKKNPFLCGSEAAAKISAANGINHIPGAAKLNSLTHGVSGFVTDAIGGNAFSSPH